MFCVDSMTSLIEILVVGPEGFILVDGIVIAVMISGAQRFLEVAELGLFEFDRVDSLLVEALVVE